MHAKASTALKLASRVSKAQFHCRRVPDTAASKGQKRIISNQINASRIKLCRSQKPERRRVMHIDVLAGILAGKSQEANFKATCRAAAEPGIFSRRVDQT